MAQDKKQSIEQSSKQSINVELIKSNLEQLKSDALVVFVSKKATKAEKKAATPTILVEGVSKAIEDKVSAAAGFGTLTGAAQEAVLFRDTHFSGTKHLIVVGLGEAKGLTAETLRQSAAQAAAQIKSAKIKSAAIAMDSIAHTALSAETITQAVTEGILLAAYGFNEFKT